jgi:hypothetical protein
MSALTATAAGAAAGAAYVDAGETAGVTADKLTGPAGAAATW